ncbi:hypothetical protein J5N97_005484 [Dioscorea zingiberensis]|uniref:Uncharacterized protein n=1 Tax=Dioscorea zingiberensis TaxID=325984 RepID=A0A9D5DAC1_9LILI|nr:hypothetical protein J5N97_005484 [Dioscorea zingiberensis]
MGPATGLAGGVQGNGAFPDSDDCGAGAVAPACTLQRDPHPCGAPPLPPLSSLICVLLSCRVFALQLFLMVIPLSDDGIKI